MDTHAAADDTAKKLFFTLQTPLKHSLLSSTNHITFNDFLTNNPAFHAEFLTSHDTAFQFKRISVISLRPIPTKPSV